MANFNNDQINEALQGLMQALSGDTESNNPSPELEVEDTTPVEYESRILVILQGQSKQPSRESLASLIGSSATFESMKNQFFQASSSAVAVGVTVTMDGESRQYAESDQLPGYLLDGSDLRITYSVASGRNG